MSVTTRLRPRGRGSLARCATAVLLAGGVLTVFAATQASAATNDIYVANSSSNSVSAVDPTTDTVVATIPVGSFPEAVAVSPDGSQAWVVNNGDGTVSVISTATNTVTTSLQVGTGPESVTFSADGTRAYIGIPENQPGGPGVIEVWDTDTETQTAGVVVGFRPGAIAVSPDGSRVYVASYGHGSDGSVSVINAATNTVIATITGSGMQTPSSITLSPDGTRAYVADDTANDIFVIDTATNTVTDRISIPGGASDVSLTRDGRYAYVADGTNAVSVIDTATDTIIATIPVGESPVGVLVSSDGTTAFTANANSNTVSVIDTATNTVTGTIAVGTFPQALAQAPAVLLPAVTSVSPDSGVLGGGTTVTITGTSFTGVSAVSFGRTAATSFTVNSDTSITATAPSAAGVGTVDVTVTTPAGTSAPMPADQYSYIYPFSGFLPPVANPPAVNTENAGRTVPIKFSLGGNYGLGVLAMDYPLLQPVDCTTGTPVGRSSVLNNSLQYSAGTYTYVWKTDKAFAGTCQVFMLGLNDGTVYTANFKFS